MLSQRQAARTEFDFIICVKNLTMAFLHTLKDFSGSVMDSELTHITDPDVLAKDFSGSVMDSELTVRIGTRIRSSIKLQGTMNITFVLLIIL